MSECIHAQKFKKINKYYILHILHYHFNNALYTTISHALFYNILY